MKAKSPNNMTLTLSLDTNMLLEGKSSEFTE